jgi:2-oxoisovalerate dehydrogenase E1 component alpha subunit
MSATKKSASKSKSSSSAKGLGLSDELCLEMLDLMIKARVLEERMIKIYKSGESYFWIGGPGEEAFGVPLGLLTHKGRGVEYDYLHLHYRCSPTLIAMGMPMIDAIRIMMSRATDTSTGGKNFSNHYCYPEWNVVPVSSPIEVQYSMGIGTALAQKRAHKKNLKNGITIVTGGDAGTAEGDFASALVWASRKGNELPMLLTVQNNGWGISTPYEGQHGETHIADRGKAFNMRTGVINGNDPIETYLRIKEDMDYIRETGKPVLLEAYVSRLYGHSSASGLTRFAELDCIEEYSKKLMKAELISEKEVKEIFEKYEDEGQKAQEIVRGEPPPQAEDVWKHIYADNENADWRKF